MLWEKGHGSPFLQELVLDLAFDSPLANDDFLPACGICPDSTLMLVRNARPLFLSCSFDKTIRLWDADSENSDCVQKLEHSHLQSALMVNADIKSMRMIVGFNGGESRLLDMQTGAILQRFEGHEQAVTCVAVDWAAGRAITASWDKTLALWDFGSPNPVHTFFGHTREVLWLSASWLVQKVASASPDGSLRIWDMESASCLQEFHDAGRAGVLTVEVNIGFADAVSGSEVGILRVWDLHAGTCTGLLVGHERAIWSVAVDWEGKNCVSCSADGSLRLWDLRTFSMLRLFLGHESCVWRVAVDWEKKRLISASHDLTLKLWNLEDGSCQRTFCGHENSVVHATFL